MSRKGEETGKAEKQISDWVLLSAGYHLPDQGTFLASVGHPIKSNMESHTFPQAINQRYIKCEPCISKKTYECPSIKLPIVL